MSKNNSNESEENWSVAAESAGFIRPRTLFLVAFLYCGFLAVVVQKLLLPLMPDLHAGHGLVIGDSIIFHEAAWKMAQEIRATGWQEWRLFPTGFTGNVGFLSALYVVFGPSPLVFLPFNIAAHALGAVMLYRIGPLLVPGRKGLLGGIIGATLFVIFPSALLWYSQNHKDAFAIAGILLLLYVWIKIQKSDPVRRPWVLLLLVLAGILLVVFVRPYLIIVVAAGFFISYLVCVVGECIWSRQNPNWQREARLVAFLMVMACGAILGKSIPSPSTLSAFEGQLVTRSGDHEKRADLERLRNWKWESKGETPGWVNDGVVPGWMDALLERISVLRVNYLLHNLYEEAGSEIDWDRAPSNASSALQYIPRAIFIGCFAPFPESWANRVSLPQLAVAGETFIWYILFAGIFIVGYKYPSRGLFSAIFFSVVIISVYSYTTPNVGTLYRVRFGFWMFLLLCGAVGWASVIWSFFSRVSEFSEGTEENGEIEGTGTVRGQDPKLSSVAAAGTVTLLITFCGFLGFLIRDLLLIDQMGMSERMDVFFSAMMLPMVFVNCLALPLGDTIMRPFIEAHQKGESGDDGVVIRKFLGVACLVMGGATVLIVLFANVFVRIILVDETPEAIEAGTYYIRLFAPVVFLSGWTVTGNCVLNGLHRARHAALAQLVVPVCSVTLILMAEKNSVLLAGIGGMLFGTFMNATIVGYLCRRHEIALWPSWPRGAIVLSRMRSYAWLCLTAVFTAVAVPVNFSFAGSTGPGGLAAWAFASKIVALFTSLFAVSVTAVVLPFLARKFHYESSGSSRNQLYFMAVAGTWAGILIAVGISIFSGPIVFALFSDGDVSEARMVDLAGVLRIGAMQIPVAIAGAILLKSVVVSGETKATVLASSLGLAGNVLTNVFLVPRMGIEGVAVGSLVFLVVSTFSLSVSLRKRFSTSFRFSFILLFGWIACGIASSAIALSNMLALLAGVAALLGLGAMHYLAWRFGFHHRTLLSSEP